MENRGLETENFYCLKAYLKISALIASGRYDPFEQQSVEFSPTELHILQFLCEDYESKENAEKMNISLVIINRYRM